MSDLVLRRYDPVNPAKSWCLQLRRAGMAEIEYITLATGDESWAREIVEAGAPFWLHGLPGGKSMTIEEQREPGWYLAHVVGDGPDRRRYVEWTGAGWLVPPNLPNGTDLTIKDARPAPDPVTLQQYERAMRVVEAARQKIEQVRQRTPHLMLSGEDQRIADALAALDSPSPGETGEVK